MFAINRLSYRIMCFLLLLLWCSSENKLRISLFPATIFGVLHSLNFTNAYAENAHLSFSLNCQQQYVTCSSRLYQVKLHWIAENFFFHNVSRITFTYVSLPLFRLLRNLKITYVNKLRVFNLTFTGPCIVIYSYNKSQRDALFLTSLADSQYN